MNEVLENLNDKQREAVLQTEGPVMAIAGAGSGKTSVLTSRIAHLIYDVNVNYNNILALTFTNKAANEMKMRVRKITGINTRDMWISTFHSMCSKILRNHIDLLGYKKSFQIIDDDDTLQMVKSIMKKANYDIKLYNPKAVRTKIIKMKSDDGVIETIEEPLKSLLNVVFPIYQKRLFKNNLLDFEDLLILTIKLLKENEPVRDYYHKLFQYVLVDEFQDTNNIQYELIKILLNKNNNIFIVGDEDQSIYAFRGANIENIFKFKKDFPKFHLVILEENFRSTNNILTAANQIIENNSKRIPKNLYSKKGKGELITHYKGVTSRDEVEFVALKVIELVRKGYSYSDFAVLYRANSTSRTFEEVFMQKQIPYKIFGNTSFFKRKEIKDFTAYLRLIVNPEDDFSFVRVVNEPRRGIGAKTLELMANFATDNGLNFMETIDYVKDFLGASVSKKLIAFKELISDFRIQLNKISFNDLVDYMLETSGYLNALKKDEKGDVRYENLLEFKTMLNENSDANIKDTKEEQLVKLLGDIALKVDEKKEEVEDGVNFMTLHSAKGLEFRVVFLVTLENGMFPLGRAFESIKDFEEERRLMYVGVTRAKEQLFLTNAKQRQTYGEVVSNPDSVFIKEIDQSLIKVRGYEQYINKPFSKPLSAGGTKLIKRKKKNLDNYKENNINKGDKVQHTIFGDGVVVNVVGDTCTIAFKVPHGIKKLLKNHAALKKL